MSETVSYTRWVPWCGESELRDHIREGRFGKPAGREYDFLPIRPISVRFLPTDGRDYAVAVAAAYAPTEVPGVPEKYLYCLAFGVHGGVPSGVDMGVYRAVQDGLPEPEPGSWQWDRAYFYYGWVANWLNRHLPQVARLAFWAAWAQATDSVVPIGSSAPDGVPEPHQRVVLVNLEGRSALRGHLHRHLDEFMIVAPEVLSAVGNVQPPGRAIFRLSSPMLGAGIHTILEGAAIQASGRTWLVSVANRRYLVSRGIFN